MDLVLTKWIALKGTSVLASCRVEELSSRFPSVMIRDAAGFTCYCPQSESTRSQEGMVLPPFTRLEKAGY